MSSHSVSQSPISQFVILTDFLCGLLLNNFKNLSSCFSDCQKQQRTGAKCSSYILKTTGRGFSLRGKGAKVKINVSIHVPVYTKGNTRLLRLISLKRLRSEDDVWGVASECQPSYPGRARLRSSESPTLPATRGQHPLLVRAEDRGKILLTIFSVSNIPIQNDNLDQALKFPMFETVTVIKFCVGTQHAGKRLKRRVGAARPGLGGARQISPCWEFLQGASPFKGDRTIGCCGLGQGY